MEDGVKCGDHLPIEDGMQCDEHWPIEDGVKCDDHLPIEDEVQRDEHLPIEDGMKCNGRLSLDLSFEDGVKRLEEVVHLLEQPTVTLDVALELFGEGVALVRQCQTQLSRAEERMAVLLEDSDGRLELQNRDS